MSGEVAMSGASGIGNQIRNAVVAERKRWSDITEESLMHDSMVEFHGAEYVRGWNAHREVMLDILRKDSERLPEIG